MSSTCKHCGVTITDKTTSCPLCQNVLEDLTFDGIQTYPDIKERFKKLELFKRMIQFAGIVTIVLCCFVDFKINRSFGWSIYVIGAVLYGGIVLFTFLNPTSGYRKRIFFTLFGGVLLVLLIDLKTGFHGWSVNFVLPGMIFFLNVGLLVLMIINRRNWQSYMIYQIGVILIGLIPLALIFKGIVKYPMLSELAVLSSVFVFIGTLIFGGRVAKIELKRRFHI